MNSHDFDGIKVIHRSPRFGEGKIVELTDRYITIQFDNEAEAGSTHRFIFPDSFFNNQLLVTRNKRLRNYLAEHSEGFRCARCGTYTVSPVIPGIGVLCDSCQSKVAVCDRCNHSFYKKDCVALAQKPGHYLCRTCFDIKFPKCFICHKTIAPGSNEATPEIENGRPICSDCLEKYYIECPKCGVILKKDDCFTLSDPAGYADYLCPECAEKYVCHCAICGSEFILRSEKSPHICHDCLIKMDYEAFMDHFDLDKCSKESYYFFQFQQMKSVSLMSRIKQERHSRSFCSYYKKQNLDALLVRIHPSNLVIIGSFPDSLSGFYNGSCTVSEWKRNEDYYWTFFNNRAILKTVTLADGSVFRIWKHPFKLRAQTVYDMDYGDRWYGDTVDYGNKYGDTSSFFIVGDTIPFDSAK